MRESNILKPMATNIRNYWYYQACNECIGKVYDGNEEAYCVNHGLQKTALYRYIFKALLRDPSGSAMVTFFTPNADSLTGASCTELVQKYDIPAPNEYTKEILSLKHILTQFLTSRYRLLAHLTLPKHLQTHRRLERRYHLMKVMVVEEAEGQI